jgi:phage terminase large subunit-like protein
MAGRPADRRIGKYERLARDRQARDIALTRQPGGHPRGLWFDDAEADRVVDFIEGYCRHYKGEWAGQLLKLQPWAKDDVIRPIFGWKRPDGTRRFRTAWEELARKNGKTTKAAAGALYMLVGDGEKGGEVYCTATKQDQAKILHHDATEMVRASEELREFILCSRNNLSCARLGSKFEPLGADSETLDGLNPHAHFPDEVHAHKDAGVWNKLDTAMGSRRQPLTWAITTAGIYDKESIGWRKHEYATQILEGVFEDDEFFAYIAAVDDGDDPYDPANWQKANPNLGVSIYESFMRGQAAKAQRDPLFYNEFLQLHLNRWTQQATRWITPEQWTACDPVSAAAALEQREGWEKTLQGRACAGGLDLSSKLDLTAFALAFPRPDGAVDLLLRFWMPEARVEAELRKGQKHFAQWVKDGWIKTTPGEVIDYAFVRREINDLGKLYSIGEIAFDPWNAQQLATELEEQDGFTMVEFRQGFTSMSEPSKDFEARTISRRLRHGGNPVLAWNVGNAVVRRDPAGNIKPDKEKAKGRIDGLVAAIMAIGRAVLQERSIYSGERGLLSV